MVCLTAAGGIFVAAISTPHQPQQGAFFWAFIDRSSKWSGGEKKFADVFNLSSGALSGEPVKDGKALVFGVEVGTGVFSAVLLGVSNPNALACLQRMEGMEVVVAYVGKRVVGTTTTYFSCATGTTYAVMPKRTLHVCLRPFINRGAATDKDLFEGDQAPASRGRLQRQVNAIFEDICTEIEVHKGNDVDGNQAKLTPFFGPDGSFDVERAQTVLGSDNEQFGGATCINVYLVSKVKCKKVIRAGCAVGDLSFKPKEFFLALSADEDDLSRGSEDARILAHEIGHLFGIDHLKVNGKEETGPELGDAPVNLAGTVRGVVPGGDPAKDKTQNLMLATLQGEPQSGFPVTWRNEQIQQAGKILSEFFCQKGKAGK
ncbi:MAG: hypothetical protein HY719_16210 [Planctomycetes bacterium]|nr:hypothetical protein [Planctomycetota bacterium]